LPGKAPVITGYAADALVLDEACYIADSLFYATRPMLAVSGRRLIALSSANGQRSWFWRAWVSDEDWLRVKVPATEVSRIPPAFLEVERSSLPEAVYASEYMAEFRSAADSVFDADSVHGALTGEVVPLFGAPGHQLGLPESGVTPIFGASS